MKNNKKNLLIIGGIFLALIVVVILLSFKSSVKKLPEDTIGNTAGNLNNGGLFCEYDGKVYFSNAYDSGTLYVMNPDETGVKSNAVSRNTVIIFIFIFCFVSYF